VNDDVFQAFQSLNESEQKSLLSTLLSRLQLDLNASSFEDQYASGYGYGGRVGYRQPVGEDALTFGLRGSGFKAETPFGTFKDRGVSGGDIGYEFGPNRISASYENQGYIGNELGGIPVDDLVRLLYTRQF
jgi:hypothetical protein